MSPRSGLGRLVMSGLGGEGLDGPTSRALEEGRVGALILFRDDFSSLGDAARLIREARERASGPILVGLDEEGGLVSQIDGLPLDASGRACAASMPSPAALGEIGDPALTRAANEVVARVLDLAGFDIVFAPVLDVNVGAANPVIGRRAFGSTPRLVTAHGVAALRGLAGAGLLACAKHFPGHGASVTDSHVALPVIDADRVTIDARELPPFRSAIAEGVPLVMAAHATYPALDDESVPATRSHEIVGALLRKTLGFDGVVVSDALEMKGFTLGAPDDGFERALGAGVDLFLVAREPVLALEAEAALSSLAATGGRLRAAADLALERVESLVLSRERRRASEPIRDGAATSEGLERAVEAGRELLRSLHDRSTYLDGAPLRPPYHIVCPAQPAHSHLNPAEAVAALSAALGSTPSLLVVDENAPPSPDELPGQGTALVIELVRGVEPAAASARVRELAGAWSRLGERRCVGVLAAGDHQGRETLPATFTWLGMSGCHASAFHAAGRAMAAAARTD